MIYVSSNTINQESLETACESLNAIGRGITEIVRQTASNTADLAKSLFSLGIETCSHNQNKKNYTLIEPHVPVPPNMGRPIHASSENLNVLLQLFKNGWGNSTLSMHRMHTLTAQVAEQFLAQGREIPQNNSGD